MIVEFRNFLKAKIPLLKVVSVSLIALLFCLELEAENPDLSRSIFKYSPSQSLVGQIACHHDIVVLNDGTSLSCDLTSLPALSYSFGNVLLNSKDVLFFLANPMTNKCEVRMKNGMRFVSSLEREEISFLTYVPKTAGILAKQFRAISNEEISLLIPRPKPLSKSPNQWFSLMLSNEDVIPVEILDPEIFLTSEGEKKTIKTKDILDLHFNGVLQGKLKHEEVGLAFVTSPNLTVALLPSYETIKIPWTNISKISAPGAQLDQNPLLPPFIEDDDKQILQNSDFLPEPLPLFATDQPLDIPDITFIKEKKSENIVGVAFINAANLFTAGAFHAEQLRNKFHAEKKASGITAKKPQQKVDGQSRKLPFKNVEYIAHQSSYKKPNTISQKKDKPKEKMQHVTTTEYYAGFYIQPKKVTNQEYSQFVKAVNYKPPAHWGGDCPPQSEESQPVVNICYKDCLLYAVWAKSRLPTEEELMIAKKHALLEDLDDSLDEWTATPYIFSKGRYPKKMENSKKIGRDCSQGHVIFGKRSPKPLNNCDFNPKTGFRLVHD